MMSEFEKHIEHCPGKKHATAAFFKCPECGGQIEIWSDEDAGTCPNCNKDFSRP